MKVTREKSNNNKTFNYYLEKDNKILRISFEGNLDLYWSITNKQNKGDYYEEPLSETFIITKENYYIYTLFEELYNDILEAKVYQIEDNEDLSEIKLKMYQIMNKNIKSNYRYIILCDEEDIIWHSDEETYDIANRLKISKIDDSIYLEFSRVPLKLKENLFESMNTISIRFRNSGSRYEPFNVIFMRMYNKLQNYDPDYHQHHIEEIYYQKKKVLK